MDELLRHDRQNTTPDDALSASPILFRTMAMEKTQPTGSILVKRMDAVGDVLLASAVLSFLARRFPNHVVDFATLYPEVIAGSRHLSRVIAPKSITQGSYEHVFDLDLAYENRPGRSILAAYAEVVGCAVDELQPSLNIPATSVDEATRVLAENGVAVSSSLVAVQSSSNSWVRNWPVESLQSLVSELSHQYAATFLLLGSTEDPHVMGTVDLRGRCSLSVSVAILARCRAFIGPDSSFVHFSKALGIPVAAFYGPIDPALRIRQTEQDVVIVSGASCRFCHHRQRPPAFITVCTKQPAHLVLADSIVQGAMRWARVRSNRVAGRVVRHLWALLNWREKGGRSPLCMRQIEWQSVAAQLIPWLGRLGFERRATGGLDAGPSS